MLFSSLPSKCMAQDSNVICVWEVVTERWDSYIFQGIGKVLKSVIFGSFRSSKFALQDLKILPQSLRGINIFCWTIIQSCTLVENDQFCVTAFLHHHHFHALHPPKTWSLHWPTSLISECHLQDNFFHPPSSVMLSRQHCRLHIHEYLWTGRRQYCLMLSCLHQVWWVVTSILIN